MVSRDFLLSVIDLLLLFVILFLLTFFAIRFDANRGFGDHDYVKLNSVLSGDEDIKGDFYALNYFPIVLYKNKIKLYHYVDGKNELIDEYVSAQNFFDDKIINDNKIYVVYEKEKSPILPDIVRLFLINNIPLGVAELKL